MRSLIGQTGIVWLVAACSGGVPIDLDEDQPPIMLMTPDGGSVGFDFVPTAPAPAQEADTDVEAPAAPVLVPCPDGWREVQEGEGPATCEPFGGDAPDPSSCGETSTLLPGRSGCVEVGSACPADGFPEGLPEEGVLYVQAGAPAGGDGSRASPLASPTEAIAAAEAGSVVALAAGTYDAAFDVPAGVTLWGACPAETHLESSDPTPVLTLAAGDVTVRNLSLHGSGPALWIEGETTRATLEDLVASDVGEVALAVTESAQVELRRVLVRRVAPGDDGSWGRGVVATEGASARMVEVAVEEAREAAITASAGASLELDRVVARGTLHDGDGQLGAALWVDDGGQATVTRSVFESNRDIAVVVDAESSVSFDHVLVRDTAPTADGSHGWGLFTRSGSRAELRRTVVARSRTAGIVTQSAELHMSDSVVRHVREEPQSGSFGRAASLQDGTTAELERVWLGDCRQFGLYVSGPSLPSTVTARDLTVENVREVASGIPGGHGIQMTWDVDFTLERARIADAREAGVSVRHGAQAALGDVTVVGVRALPDDTPGVSQDPSCIHVSEDGTHLRLARALLEDCENSGLFASFGGSAELSDLHVRDILLRRANGLQGRGILVLDGASLDLERALLERSPEAGIYLWGSSATVRDLTVREGVGTSSGLGGRAVSVLGLEKPLGSGQIAPSAFDGERLHFEAAREVAFAVEHTITTEAFGDDPPPVDPEEQTTARIRDVSVIGTRTAALGLGGRAFVTQGGGRLEVTRALVEDNGEVAVMALHQDSVTVLEDVWVRDTHETRCDVCAPWGGIGLGSYDGGRLEATRFRVEGSLIIGVQLARGGRAALSHGVVADNPVGVNLQNPEQPLEWLTADVAFVGNDRNIDATELPTPALGL